MTNQIKVNEPIRVFFNYDNNSYSLMPLKVTDNFMLCASEYDFMFDGYTIRKLEDVEHVIANNTYLDLVNAENVFKDIQTPNIKINGWKDIFTSLTCLNENIIIETLNLDNDFYLGKIEKVNNTNLKFKTLDCNANWNKKLTTINFKDITSITLKSRYINVFSKYAK